MNIHTTVHTVKRTTTTTTTSVEVTVANLLKMLACQPRGSTTQVRAYTNTGDVVEDVSYLIIVFETVDSTVEKSDG